MCNDQAINPGVAQKWEYQTCTMLYESFSPTCPISTLVLNVLLISFQEKEHSGLGHQWSKWHLWSICGRATDTLSLGLV